MSETITGAEMVVRTLQDQDVAHIFGYPGGAVLPIYDAIFQQNSLEHILVRHEQGAVHAAEGYARSSGKVGVVLVTSGPGATNAVTGLTDALLDSIPVVCFTGQVPTHLIGSDAFQECDTVGITRHCTKHNYLVKRVEDLPRIIHEAFYVARSGRPGPVVIDIPKDVQFATGVCTGPGDVIHKSYRPKVDGDIPRIEAAVAMMPCSAAGVARRLPDIKWLRRESDIAQFARQSSRILDAMWQVLAPGGKMLFVTCSVFARENQQQMTAFCDRHADCRPIPLGDPGAGIAPSTDHLLLPTALHDGFFFALLAKQS